MGKSREGLNMKTKNKKNFNILPIIIIPVIIFIGYLGYAKLFTDHTPPVITLDSDTLTVSVHDDEDALLKGVTAEDNKDGDLTSSVVVEKKTPLEDGKRTVTYAVIDSEGNIGRAERTVSYIGYDGIIFNLTAPMRFAKESEFDILDYIEVVNDVDGELHSKIKYTTGLDYFGGAPNEYQIEFSVTDSTGTTAHLPVIVEIYDPEKEAYSIELTDYLVYVEKGDSFDPMTYYAGSDAGMSLKLNPT